MKSNPSPEVNRVRAVYQLETALDPMSVAETIAGEQSSGTFIALPQENEELLNRASARVEDLQEIEVSTDPALPGSRVPNGAQIRRYSLTLSWPLANFGPSLPNLVATVAGNLFELQQVAGLKLLDIELPQSFASVYPGPAFGISGTRDVTGVFGRPLIGTIIKPSVGLSPQDTAHIVASLCEGGIDFIKDDELQADGPSCPFDERLKAVMTVIERYREKTGRRVMYAANITGELDEMLRRHDLIEAAGGVCAMISLNSVGLVGVTALRKHSRLVLHAHRNGWGYLGRSASNGWSYVAWQKLWRLAGVDHMHVNGLSNKFWEPDDSVLASARACVAPMFASNPCRVLPVFSSGQSAKQAAPTWKALNSPDLLYCAGGGIAAHPGGVAAGVQALRDAWDAAMADIPIEQAAKASTPLRQALETFGQ